MERETRQRFTPLEKGVLNPHKGCCTFQRFNGDPLYPGQTWSEAGPTEFPEPEKHCIGTSVTADTFCFTVDGYLPSTVAYCRWFWRLMQPTEGEYDFSVIDEALATAVNRGQTLAVRLMPYGSHAQPQIPDWYSRAYPCMPRGNGDAAHIVPDHDSPEYLRLWGGFIREFARRYDDDPRLESIDIAYLGPWGEGAGDCRQETCTAFAELWTDSFKSTPCLALVQERQLREGVARESGWRCDCFGDSAFRGSSEVPCHLSWNHMYDCYPEAVCKANAQQAWQCAPVHLETCWVPQTWLDHGGNIDFIVQQGLKYHATYFMPKSCRLPAVWLDSLEAFSLGLGYNFVLHQVRCSRIAESGKPFVFSAWVENTGVAPIYRRYAVALRFRQPDREYITRLDDIDIRTWLPGDAWIDRPLGLPDGIRPGPCDIAIGLVDTDNRPCLRWAVKEHFPDLWTPIGLAIIEV